MSSILMKTSHDKAIVLTPSEIMKVVNRWIGVTGGYLGDFSYRTHAEFYPEYCDLDDIDPNKFEGMTTRERFIAILGSVEPRAQARILRGVLERFSLSGDGAPKTRTAELNQSIHRMIERLENASPISSPEPKIQSAVVIRALADAEVLIRNQDPTSAIDRVHTSLHGYLIAACSQAVISHPDDASLTALLKLLRKHHPKLQDIGPRSDEIERVLNACATIVDALNPLRNRASIAHPNTQLLDSKEAMLVINVARSLLHYMDAKLA